MDWKYHKAWRETCLLRSLSRFCLSHELCWRLTTRMITIFIIMYPITNTVFSFPNWFQLRSEWKHCLSNHNPVTILQFQFIAIDTMDLDGLSDKAGKIGQKRDRKKQRRERERTGQQKQTGGRRKRRCAHQAPVHYLSMETEQRPGPQMWLSAASLESLVPAE